MLFTGEYKMKDNKLKISCKRGFTLIELLVVVLIIGILALDQGPTQSRFSYGWRVKFASNYVSKRHKRAHRNQVFTHIKTRFIHAVFTVEE